MIFKATGFQDLFIIEAAVMKDERGEFFRIFDRDLVKKNLFAFEIVQANRSVNFKKGTLRGMHYQRAPYSESKIIQCTKGSMYDVVIDLRKNSPTFLKSFSMELSAATKLQLAVPAGFAHGFQTLEDNTEVLYLHSREYHKESEGAIRYNDPAIGIHWPLPISHLSDRDMGHPYIDSSFEGI